MAERKSNEQAAGKQPSPPLDDPRWIILIMAHHIRSEQLIGGRFSSLASSHLMEGLKSGKLRCMRESMTNPSKREQVPTSFWQNLNIHVEADLKLIQIQRAPSIQQVTPRDLGQIYDWAFYVWKPDFDRLWPKAEADQKSEPLMRRKAGRKPTENWQAFVLGALAVFVKDGKQVPPASYFAQLCEDELSYQPDLREIQKLIRKRLG